MIATTRLPYETAKAYAAFQAYVALGDQRSQHAVARKLAKSRQIIGRWSARWKWKERIAALQVTDHQQQLDANARAKLEAARKREAIGLRVLERGEVLFNKMSEKAEIMLDMPSANVVESPDLRPGKKGKLAHYHPANASYFNAAARLAEAADNLGRLAAGLPTSNSVVTGKDGASLGAPLEPIIHKVYLTENAASREARKQFGKRPPEKMRR